MKKILLTACLIACSLMAKTKGQTQYVNPSMGIQSSFELLTGNTYLVIAHPWGIDFWTSQTGKMGDGWQYMYTANKIKGFKQTHQPSPWIGDYGQFFIMPITGKPKFGEEERANQFGHKGEVATLAYYKVHLAEHDIMTEITSTEHAVLSRFIFPENGHSYVVVDAFDKGSYARVIPEENKTVGYTTRNSGRVPENFKNYLVIGLDKPFSYGGTFVDKKLEESSLGQKADHTGAVIGFRTRKGEIVHARIVSSFISFEQATQNLQELGNNSLEQLVQKGNDAWNHILDKIEVESGNLDQYRTFYFCLHRSLLFPRKFYGLTVDGQPIHYSPYSGQVLPGYMCTDIGFWDTSRYSFPFLNLIYSPVSKEIQEGLINIYKENGFFPEWAGPRYRGCMIGNDLTSVLTDAYLKGVEVDDVKTLYEGLIHSTKDVYPEVSSTGRLDYQYYNKLGYVPYDVKINENAACALEYAYDDWCTYQLDKVLNHPQGEAEQFAKHVMNYRNVLDRESKLMRDRNESGQFQSPFSPLKWGGVFIEDDSRHHSWPVFCGPQGLIDLMGGKRMSITMLNSVFTVPPVFDNSYHGQVIHEIHEMTVMNVGNYARGNQPTQHMIYLYNYAGQPWEAQYWLRQVMDCMYVPGPNSYCGDGDNGQASARHVFSALGFYPVCPDTDEYALGAPLFKKATLHFENGNSLVIDAPDNSRENLHIKSLCMNGKESSRNYLKHGDLLKGGILEFKMGSQPDLNRGISEEDAPYSFSKEK